MNPKYGTSSLRLVAVSLRCPSCSVHGRASRRPLTPNQHDTAQVSLFITSLFPRCMALSHTLACMFLLTRAAYPFRAQADVPWHLPVASGCKDSPFTYRALVMRQPVPMALHVALVQRRAAWSRNAATQVVAWTSSASQGAPSIIGRRSDVKRSLRTGTLLS